MKSSRNPTRNGENCGAFDRSGHGLGRLGSPSVTALFAVLAIGLLTGASCKKDTNQAEGDPKAIVAAADSAKAGTTTPAAPVDRTPLVGVDVSAMPATKQDLFYKLVAALPSPCGKAHSLRTSVASDPACKRAPFAARMVAEMLADESPEDDVRKYYDERYTKNTKVHSFDLAQSPVEGAATAPVALVEFFDYGCGGCLRLKPLLEQVLAENQSRVKIIYKMYPLPIHPDSFGAAQAAVAAQAQGKFPEMHNLIFAKFGAHAKDALRAYAQSLGLDMAKYEADFAAAEARVKAEMKEGSDAGVGGTPTVFLNGRLFPGPFAPKYFAAAIDEELAARR